MQLNKDENVHRFPLSTIRRKLLEREREREREREKERERKREKERERERKREREREREREQQILNGIEIDTHLFVN